MAFDMQKLMRDPGMIAAMNLMAQSGFQPGASAGSRLGRAGLNTARDLQALENASANRTWRARQSEIQEERNRIAQDMNMRRQELAEKQYAEDLRANQAKERLYTQRPQAVKEDGKTVGYTYGGSFSRSPRMSLEDILLMNMFGGMGPMNLGLGGDTGTTTDPYSAAAQMYSTPPAEGKGSGGGPGPEVDIDRTRRAIPLPPPEPVTPQPVLPQSRGPFETMGRNALAAMSPINRGRPITPQERLALERIRFLGGAY